MLFNSVSFLFFFVVVSILYYVLPHRYRWVMLLAASCYFYMAFVPAYILILFYLIAIDFAAGIFIERSEGKRRKAWLTASVIANVGTLFFFKYFNFFNANVARVAALVHWNYSPLALSIMLPLGLSFHTFQSLAYVIEVYRRHYKAERHLGIYALYVLFFPQLVAGPIERPQELLPQLHATHEFNEGTISQGAKIMLWGFFKKVVVADNIGLVADAIYGDLHRANGITLAIAAVAFLLQLYGDFSGYSDIARGAARVFGITLVNNFDTPFFSRSVAEFWRRWHISLTSWFRDYFYYPLAVSLAGGSRLGLYFSIFVTFVVLGIWHGAGWTFIFFGVTFGCYSVIGSATQKLRAKIAGLVGLSRVPAFYAGLQGLATFLLVATGFIFFRAVSSGDAFYILSHLFSGWGSILNRQFWDRVMIYLVSKDLIRSQLIAIAISCLIMLGGEYFEKKKQLSESLMARPRWFRWGAYYVLILWMFIFGYYQQRTFIYFQF